MKILAIEGIDKSGKHSASKMLAERLAAQGLTVVQSEFHRYDTPTGKLIFDWLTNKYDVDQTTIELIMAADKQAQQKWFDELEQQGVDVLILDRYTTSQMVYSQANGVDIHWAGQLQRFMRKPDFEVLLDIPAELSMSRKGKHNNGENDRYERDRDLLTRINEILEARFAFLAMYDRGVVIDATQSLDKVHEDLWKAIPNTIKGESL